MYNSAPSTLVVKTRNQIPQTFTLFKSKMQSCDELDDRGSFDHSSLSFDLDNQVFNTSGSNTETIQLSDLTAPPRICPCFKWHRLKRLGRHRRHSPSRFIPYSPNRMVDNGCTLTPKNDTEHELVQARIDPDDSKEANHITGSNHNSTVELRVPGSCSLDPDQSMRSRLSAKLKRLCLCSGRLVEAGQIARLQKNLQMSLWSILGILVVSTSFCVIFECGTRVYVVRSKKNHTYEDIVKPPSFVTLFATAWVLLVYPFYLIINTIVRLETNTSKEMFANHAVLIASEQPTIVKMLTRCSLLSVFWQLFIYCLERSLYIVPPIDCAAIITVLPCFTYLLSWIIVHRRFCALRVIAFILGSSGVILNIYTDQKLMWYKGLSTISVVSLALFHVILKRIVSRPTFGQFAAFYFGFGIFNLLAYLPIFVIVSLVTSVEPIEWRSVPWEHVVGFSIGLLVLIVSLDISQRKVPRAMRSVQPILTPVFCTAFRVLCLAEDTYFNNVRIVSMILVIFACLLNALPNRWLKTAAKFIQRARSPKSQSSITKPSSLLSKAASATQGTTGSTTTTQVNPSAPRASLAVPSTGSTSRPNSATNAQLNPTGGAASKMRSRLSSVLMRASANVMGD